MRDVRAAVFALILSCLLIASAPDAAGEEILRHEKYQLGNGLTVILHEDHKLPQVAVDIWYHVGTREEPRSRSGFAHLFEHLMFMGTKRVPGGQFDILMETAGGTNNASTDFDRTDYYDYGPAKMLPTLLWLEADRMESLGDAIDQRKLDLQRDVVRNERREGYDDAPYGDAELLLWERLFPVDHPYHFHVIGSHEDLLAATVDDVKAFFATYYVPNNATLVVAGDFDTKKAKPLIEGLFGTIKRGKEPPRRSAPAAALTREERVTVTDDVQFARIDLAWHSPAFYAPGDAEMDQVAFALAGGESGRLRRLLVREEQVAVEVECWQRSLRLGSVFRIQVTVKPGVALERVEKLIDEEIERVRRKGVTARELARGLAEIETETLSDLQSLLQVADLLNQYDAYLGQPDRVAWDLDRYRRASPESVKRWAGEVLAADRRLVIRTIPREAPQEGLPSRSRRPADWAARGFQVPMPNVFRLANGLEVWHYDRPGLPLVSSTLLLRGGAAAVPRERAGLAYVAADLIKEGSGDLDALAFDDALSVLGADLSVSVEPEDTLASLQVLRRNADAAFALLAGALRTPRFAVEDFARVKRQRLDAVRGMLDQPTLLARRAAFGTFFRGDPYGIPSGGHPQTLEALTLEQVRAFHDAHHGPQGAVLLLAGDLRASEARDLVDRHFGSWKQKTAPSVSSRVGAPPVKKSDGMRLVVVERPSATQTALKFLYPGMAYSDPKRVELEVLNAVFGGTFTARLNANLREAHGFTYSAYSWFQSYARGGVHTASAAVQLDATGAAIREFLREVARIQGGDVTDGEATKARETLRYEAIQAFESLSGIVQSALPYARHGLGPERLAKDLTRMIQATSAERLNALAARHIGRGGGVLVLVGDPSRIRAQLEELGLPEPIIVKAADVLAGRLP